MWIVTAVKIVIIIQNQCTLTSETKRFFTRTWPYCTEQTNRFRLFNSALGSHDLSTRDLRHLATHHCTDSLRSFLIDLQC